MRIRKAVDLGVASLALFGLVHGSIGLYKSKRYQEANRDLFLSVSYNAPQHANFWATNYFSERDLNQARAEIYAEVNGKRTDLYKGKVWDNGKNVLPCLAKLIGDAFFEKISGPLCEAANPKSGVRIPKKLEKSRIKVFYSVDPYDYIKEKDESNNQTSIVLNREDLEKLASFYRDILNGGK